MNNSSVFLRDTFMPIQLKSCFQLARPLNTVEGLKGGKSVRDYILVAALTPTLWPAYTLTFVSKTKSGS